MRSPCFLLHTTLTVRRLFLHPVVPEVSFDITSKLRFAFMYVLDWRCSLSDGVNGISHPPAPAPLETDRDRFVSDGPEVRLRDCSDRHTTLTVDYSRFHAGSFITNSATAGRSFDPLAAAIQIEF